jgi:hypothetical protein
MQFNQLRITQEQLEQIRALRATDLPTSERDAISAVTTED